MEQELLFRYFRGETSQEEEERILSWVEASPENRAEYCTSLLSAIFFNAPMLAQYRHFSPSLLRQNRQDAWMEREPVLASS